MNRVDGKVAIISGAARGLGAQTAKVLAAGGAKVVIADILDGPGQQTAAEIGASAAFVHLDVTDEDSWKAAVKFTAEKFGGLHILVNNAGIFRMQSTEETSLADWRQMIAVNLDGVFLGTKSALPVMKECAAKDPVGCSIVNLSSVAGLVGSPRAAPYCMSKGGVRIYTKACAMEFAPYRIRVNSIHPGLIDTDMGRDVIAQMAGPGGSDKNNAARDAMISWHPIGRLGVAMDIANGIAFLASDDAAFMTGSELVVDGGVTAQ
ncbi:MAG: glucose 1-dehydrogenase [Alphaproteobacteria bacterium]